MKAITSLLCLSWLYLAVFPLSGLPARAADPVKKPAAGSGKPSAKPAVQSSGSHGGSYHLAPVAVPIELTGEVVDSWCYASQVMGDGRGAHHQSCALACVMGGVTPGIVDDKGQLYLCVKHKAYTGCKDLLAPYVAKRVKVKGHLATKGGVRVLKVTAVELAK